MIQSVQVFHCANTSQHKDSMWVQMVIGQFEPERRITLHCPECHSSIAIDYTTLRGYILVSDPNNPEQQ